MSRKTTEQIIMSALAAAWPESVPHSQLIGPIRWRADWKTELRRLLRDGSVTRRVERISGQPGRPAVVYRHAVFDQVDHAKG